MPELHGHVAELHRLTRTDPDPRVRHRADALLLMAHGHGVDETAQAMAAARSGFASGASASWPKAERDWPIAHGLVAPRCWMGQRPRCWSRP